MAVDFLLPEGKAYGPVANVLLSNRFDHHALRPWVEDDGQSYVMNINRATGKLEVMTINAPASLKRDEWKVFDDAVIEAARAPLRLVADLVGQGLTYTIPNGFGKTMLEYQTHGDITPATTSMSGQRQSEEDRAEFDIGGLPLPIVHKDFSLDARTLEVSRNGNMPLDTTTAAAASRRVSELVEDYAMGLVTFSWGGRSVYGLSNLPSRKTKTLTDPTDVGWTPQTLVGELLEMIQLAQDDFQYGPFAVYFSPAWTVHLEGDYSATYPGVTLRQRIAQIDNISGVRTLPRMTGLHVFLVQMTPDVIREVIGMPMTTLQWETLGGMRLHFKVMAIMVPQLRPDQKGDAAIVHGSVP